MPMRRAALVFRHQSRRAFARRSLPLPPRSQACLRGLPLCDQQCAGRPRLPTDRGSRDAGLPFPIRKPGLALRSGPVRHELQGHLVPVRRAVGRAFRFSEIRDFVNSVGYTEHRAGGAAFWAVRRRIRRVKAGAAHPARARVVVPRALGRGRSWQLRVFRRYVRGPAIPRRMRVIPFASRCIRAPSAE